MAVLRTPAAAAVGVCLLARGDLRAAAIVAHAGVGSAEMGRPVSEPSTSVSSTGQEWDSKIPFRLFVTAKTASYDALSGSVMENLENTRSLNPGIPVTLFGDAECRDYIQVHYPGPLLAAFDNEKRGMFRGDICRAAVISVDGGFYTDLDFQPKLPFAQMVDNATTFMTASSYDGGLLNAMFGAEPGSEIMQHVLKAIMHWYGKWRMAASRSDEATPWMGVKTMLDGLRTFSEANCPGSEVQGRIQKHMRLQAACGRRQQVRLYTEQKIDCAGPRADVECPDERRSSKFPGTGFGIFEPGPARRLVAWSRFASCHSTGCGVGDKKR